MNNYEPLYKNNNSIINNWSSPIKLIFVIIYIFAISSLHSLITIGFSFIFTVSFFFFSKLKFSKLMKNILRILLFVVPFSVLLIFTIKGSHYYTFKLFFLHIKIYKEGLHISLLILLRAINIFLVLSILLMTTKPNAILHSFILFRIPYSLSLIFTLSYRYITRYFYEAQKLKTAIILRGYNGRYSNSSQNVKLYSNLLLRTYEDTDLSYKAMMLRGLTLKKPKNISFKVYPKDIFLFIIGLSFCVFLLFFENWVEINNLWKQIILILK